MKAPEFWEEDGQMAKLFLPISLLLHAATRGRRYCITPVRTPIPTICIGNVVLGGVGKTPVTIALAQMLGRQGIRVAIVSRGYKGKATDVTQVNLTHHTAKDVGDEPLLLARYAPTYVARKRLDAILTAYKAGAECILMDDGLQHPYITPDLSLLVIDAEYGLGNGKLFPSGALREPLASALKRVQAVVWTGAFPPDPDLAALIPATLPQYFVHLQFPQEIKEWLHEQSVIAFAGIGRPEKFFTNVKGAGAEMVDAHDFADHHQYSKRELQALISQAKRLGATLVTTEKDFVRLPVFARADITPLPATLVWQEEGETRIWEQIKPLFPNGATQPHW